MRKIGLFIMLLCVFPLCYAQDIKVGSKVEILASDGKLYIGTVREIIHTAHKIHYDGFDDQYDVWLTRDQFKPILSLPDTPPTAALPQAEKETTMQVGSRVEAYSSKRWDQGTIVEIKDGKFKIHFDGYSEYWDTWVGANELRAPGTNGDVKISSDKAAKGKLYLRHIRWLATGGSSLNWYFLADNGTIVVDPKHGVNPVNLAEERVDNMKNMGTYVISNNIISIKWVNGLTTEMEVEYKNGDLCRIDAFSIVMRQKGFPANYKLNGTYSGVMGVGQVAAGRTFSFSNNGTFVSSNTGYVTTGMGNAIAQNDNSGTYFINGNTLVLNYADGKIEKAPIAIWDDRLVINNTSLPLVKN